MSEPTLRRALQRNKPGDLRSPSSPTSSSRFRRDSGRRRRNGTITPPIVALWRSLPPKKSCLDSMRNAIARTAAQSVPATGAQPNTLRGSRSNRTAGAGFVGDSSACFTPSTVPLPGPRVAAARVEAWGGQGPGGVHVLLSNPR